MTHPQTLGSYRVICPLGEGGMARVYLCNSRGIGGFRKLLVVKALRSDFASDAEFLEMFLDEARIAGRLNHPNVVQTNEVGVADGTHFIAMEYLEGQPLSALIKRVSRKGMPIHLHLRILADALLGLHYAHELADFDGTKLSVVHRDVSPQNIFVTYDGATKVVDFGIAKAAGSAALTREGVLKGKVAYMAPEQAAMESVDRRADIFAVGVMLWEALAKRRLVPNGSDDLAALNRRISGKEPTLQEVAPFAPPELVEICQKAMARSPADRYATAQEMREDIESYAMDVSRAGDDVAKFMTEHFAKDRADLRALIDAQLQHPSVGKMDDLAVKSGFKRASEISDLSEASARSIKRDTKPPKRLGTNLLMIGTALILGGGIAFGLIRSKGAEPGAGASATSAADVKAVPPPASASAQAVPADVRVSISTNPPNAELSIDGERVSGTPFVKSMPRTSQPHRIEVSAGGFTKEERNVVFDHDTDLLISLAASPKVSPQHGKPAPAGDPAAAAKSGKGLRTIDDKDPYK